MYTTLILLHSKFRGRQLKTIAMVRVLAEQVIL